MKSFSQTIIYGNVGKEPECKDIGGGRLVAKFTVATDESYKDKSGEIVKKTEWHRVKVFGPLAGIVQKFVHKGSLVHVVGKNETTSWEDKQGVKKYTTEIKAYDVSFKDDFQQNTGGGDYGNQYDPNQTPAQNNDNLQQQPEEEDLPF